MIKKKVKIWISLY